MNLTYMTMSLKLYNKLKSKNDNHKVPTAKDLSMASELRLWKTRCSVINGGCILTLQQQSMAKTTHSRLNIKWMSSDKKKKKTKFNLGV